MDYKDFKEGNYAIRKHEGQIMFELTEYDMNIMKNHLDKYDLITDPNILNNLDKIASVRYSESGLKINYWNEKP